MTSPATKRPEDEILPGYPKDTDSWLAPDWSADKPQKSLQGAAVAQPSGWTYAAIRETRYADGRVVRQVLDANRQPITTQLLPSVPDDEQAKRHKDAQAAARAEAGPTETTPHVEGTPTGRTLPDGTPEYDNSRPIMVNRDASNQQVGPARSLTQAEREQWEREQSPTGQSQAEIRAATAKAAAAADKNMGSVTKTDPKTGITTKVTKFERPDGTTYEVPDTVDTGPEDAKPRQTRINPNDSTKVQEFDPTAKGGAGDWIDAGPNDAEAQRRAKEAEAKAEANKPGRAEDVWINPGDHKTYIRVKTTDPVTKTEKTVYLDPQTRQEVTPAGSTTAGIKGLPSYTPDLTKPGAGLIDRAKQLDEMMAAGQLTWEQRQEVLGQDQVLASTVANEFNAGVSLLQSNYANQTSQRNVDVSNVQHRASLANSHMQNAIGLMEHFAPYLGNTKGATGKLFMSAMAAQLGLATQYGGMQNIPREQMDPAVADWAHRAVAGARGAAPPVPGAAPPVSGAAPAVSGAAPGAPALGPARARFDTGPGNTLGPRVMTPASATSGMPPPPPGYEPALSWRAGAQQQEDVLLPPDPNAVGTGEMAFGSLLPPVAPTDPMGGPMDFGASFTSEAGVGSAPLAMRSAIPGLTPEQDEQARRELDRQIFAGARG